MSEAARPKVSPQLAAFLTLTVVVLLCAAAVYAKMELAPPPPSAFTLIPKAPGANTRAVQLRIESQPNGATVTAEHDLSAVTPFYVDLPKGETVTLRFELAGYQTVTRAITADAARLITVPLPPLP